MPGIIQKFCGKWRRTIADVLQIAANFQLGGEPVAFQRYGRGHINDTFAVSVSTREGSRRFILQRINTNVFTAPEAQMQNICRVIEHLKNKSTEMPVHLSLVPSVDGDFFLKHRDGEFWRVYHFVEGTVSFDVVQNPVQAKIAAAMFGSFQRTMSDLPGERLNETIPDFHNTPARYRQFHEAVRTNGEKRARYCRAEIDKALAWENEAGALATLHKTGQLPERIIHNDAKLDNVLFDERSSEPVCVVDFDTVMPGVAAYDFGDLVRSATSTAGEDEWEKAHMQLDYFEAIAEGYLGAVDGWLTEAELEHLPLAGQIITIETGLRFLTDYLNGDEYFRTVRPGQNLDRCRAQFALATSMEKQAGKMQDVVRSIASGLSFSDKGETS